MSTENPLLDLQLVRIVPVPRHLLWKGWTQPELLVKWFTPRPWQTVHCEIDLRPGGRFRTVMRGPEGEEHDSTGCYLEIVENERLVWTDALGPDWRPKADGFMTGMIALEDHPDGTRYTATVLHKDAADREKHAAMGFEAGWGAALDQLVEASKSFNA